MRAPLRCLALAALLFAAPLPAFPLGAVYLCTPSLRLSCQPEGCASLAPDIAELSFAPVDGSLAFCRGTHCYEGIAELDREGWPEWKVLGLARVEELPLPRAQVGRLFFASFEVNERRFVLSDIGARDQETTWFDCRQSG